MQTFKFSQVIAGPLLVLGILVLSPPPVYAADKPDWSRDDAAHLLRRAGFGGTPQQIDRTYELGRNAAVEYLISGKLPSGAAAPFEHVELQPFPKNDEGLDQRQGPERQFEMQKLRAWWIDRMVRTDRPLEEKMTLFWHGLFTSGFREGKVRRWMAQQNALFHKEAIGNYRRLTDEILHDSAMLKYLNNDENLRGHPNENLARELMELFTMGEGNGYSEKDIPEVARALTGMTPRRPMAGGNAVFIPMRHDSGIKHIFGESGNFGPDDVVTLIFDRPYPAEYLAKRLWTFFGCPEPTEQEIEPVAHALRSNNWELAPALRMLFLSQSFYSPKAKLTLIKSPIDLEVSTLRLLEVPPEPRIEFAAVNGARQLGQELFQPPNVKGWLGGEHWITSSGIYTRYNIATAMANGVYGFAGGGPMRAFINPNAAAKKTVVQTANEQANEKELTVAKKDSPASESNKSKQELRRENKQRQD